LNNFFILYRIIVLPNQRIVCGGLYPFLNHDGKGLETEEKYPVYGI